MVRLINAPHLIQAAGQPPKTIAEYIGREVSGTEPVSIAMMKSPPGWSEPGQIPEFDEYSLVLTGTLHITTRTEVIHLSSGQAAIAPAGEWVRYSSPEGADYIAVCLPAFSPEIVHRDDDTGKHGHHPDTPHPDIRYEEYGADALGLIEELWNELRDHHTIQARHFKEQAQARHFPERRDEILITNKGRKLLVHLARSPVTDQYIGFCVSSSAPGSYGEIESIYVQPAFRSLSIGTTFMKRACSWMDEDGVTEYRIVVYEGNEDSVRFYEHFGFYIRRHVLIRRDGDSL